MPGMSATLVLNEDVIIAPVSDLGADVRAQIECNDSDFAVSRLQGRSGSSIIDADAARLLTRFREPRTVVEAVILYARERSLDPNTVLDDAYPLLRGMVEKRVLVPSDKLVDAKDAARTVWAAGTRLSVGVLARTLQVLEDTEVHLLTEPDESWSVLKVERTPVPPAAAAAVRARLRHEAAFLTHLDGQLAPRLMAQGEVEGRAYLKLEFLAGADAESAAGEWRDPHDEHGLRNLLRLAQSIVRAYARLHEFGVVHGDVHPRNVIVDRAGDVRLIDFGLARGLGHNGVPSSAPRGGIPFFFDPEFAKASLTGSTPPPTSPESEQFAVAALLYSLFTGGHWQNFRLGREEMLRDIVERPVLRFADRGAREWPELEEVLGRALDKDPTRRFSSMTAFARVLDAVGLTRAAAGVPTRRMRADHEQLVDQSRLDGPWIEGLSVSPTASITYGAAGIAAGLLHIALRRGDAEVLAAADCWANVAARDMENDARFYNPEIEITRQTVGESSPYHSPSGVHAIAALVARAMGDPFQQTAAVTRFIDASRRPTAGLDLTTGRAGTLLGAAILLDAAPAMLDCAPLRELGDTTLTTLWHELDRKRAIAAGDIDYLGIAHGWAGFLYATLHWCRLSGTPLPADVPRRLDELAALALPAARGLEWPWVLRFEGDPPMMSGWCNGGAGYVFLWALASRMLENDRYLDLALGAAWSSWESPEPAETLCCGLAGRSYALLNLYRSTGDATWLTRARALAARAWKAEAVHREYEHSLYKGRFGLAVLAADLEVPEEAVMPFFEPEGYLG